MAPKRIKVTTETDTGRNTNFYDNFTNEDMTRPGLVKKIKNGDYPNHHIRVINGIETPVSNPDSTKDNNLD